MPIAVQCACGKSFRVRDEVAGGVAKCQICGRDVPVPAPAAAAPVPVAPPLPVAATPVPVPPPLPVTVASEPPPLPVSSPALEHVCPACGEPVEKGSGACVYCGEFLTAVLSDEDALRLQQERIDGIDSYMADGGVVKDAALKGRLLSLRTGVAIVLSALSAAMFAGGIRTHGDSGIALIALGVIFGVGSLIGLLVSLTNDIRASRIQTSDSAEKALRRYMMAIRTDRIAHAYAAVAPGARNLGSVPALKFEKIPASKGAFKIVDVVTFRGYWKGLHRGPSGQSRTLRVLKTRSLGKSAEDVEVVEMQVEFASYPTALLFLILINLIVAAIVIAVVTKREKRTVRKVMARRDGLWYMLEPEFSGPLDRAAMGWTVN